MAMCPLQMLHSPLFRLPPDSPPPLPKLAGTCEYFWKLLKNQQSFTSDIFEIPRRRYRSNHLNIFNMPPTQIKLVSQKFSVKILRLEKAPLQPGSLHNNPLNN